MIFPSETYDNLQKAFNHFNERLFDNRLSPVMFTLTKRKNANGYFHADQFVHNQDGDTTHQIAMNPDTMNRELLSVLATLVHEMTHLEQETFGKPGKRGHHNEEWAKIMDRVGLIPQPRHGRKVSTVIPSDGPFVEACKQLEVELPYFTSPRAIAGKKKDLSKVKHSCPTCGLNVWGKLGISVRCGDCDDELCAVE